MIDVLVDGQFAYYATPYLDEQHILKSIHTACENAKRASKYSIYKFTQEEVRKGHEGTYRTKCLSYGRDQFNWRRRSNHPGNSQAKGPYIITLERRLKPHRRSKSLRYTDRGGR